MPCIVPTCSSVKRLRTFPQNAMLANRWLQAVQTGCQLGSSWSAGWSFDSCEICDDHFGGTEQLFFDKHYMEPTGFRGSDGNPITIVTCKLCLQLYPEADVRDSEDCLQSILHNFNGENFIRKIIASHSNISSKMCRECEEKLEGIKSTLVFFSRARRNYDNLLAAVNDAEENFSRENYLFETVKTTRHFSDSESSVKIESSTAAHGSVSNNEIKDELPTEEPSIITCEGCDRKFMTQKKLQLHSAKCKACRRKLLQCSICNKIFPKMAILDKHYLDVHGLDKPYSCSECNETFKSSYGLAAHVRHIHQKVPRNLTNFPCLICPSRLCTLSELVEHVKKTHPDEDYPFLKCADCPKKFYTKLNLRKHVLVHTERTTCDICGFKACDINTLRTHKDFKHSDKRKFKCETCSKAFKTISVLKVHLRTHQGIRFPCSLCHKSFISKGLLHQHMKNYHLKDSAIFKCLLCEQTFIKSMKLTEHIGKDHSGDSYPYKKCPDCKAQFTTEFNLTMHIKSVHQASFHCKICDKRFPNKTRLTDHLARVHEKHHRHRCEICGKGLANNHILRRHRRTMHGLEESNK
ncbi:zinc finger protein 26-like [Uranotaenia lowii]|uniref:zinc finger protein 26-like n=1 Tax=Uranotaenia lowii TaxID=190385 RepID=UPI00247B22CD|nr:zinc finger protein 26-like [Uranotaenia lowii]